MIEAREFHLRPSPFAPGKPALAAFVLATAIVSVPPSAFGQDRMSRRAAEEIEALMAEKAARTPTERRIDSQLLLEMKRRRGDAIARRVPRLHTGIATARDGSTLVDIRARVTPELVAHIEALGGTVLGHYARYRAMRALVPLARLEAVASAPDVDFVAPAIEPITHKLNTSEGDARHRADVARATFGVDGSGVDVCALSDSVDHLAAVQASGDLPAVTVLPGQSGVPGSGEGTAMLEIIHDLVPGAGLFFATAFGGEAGFANNILALRSAGCDVIVDDVFYLTEPVFQDGIIAQAVQTVTAGGAFYFSSAGNSGNLNDGTSGVWEGDFVASATTPSPLAGSEVHDFGGVDRNTVTNDSPFWFSLQWSDAQGLSGNDYDLYLLDPTASFVEAASTNIQNGNDNPFEFISSRGNNDTGSHLVIVRKAGAAARYLHLNTHRGRLAVATDGQVNGHSAVVDAFAVAAVDVAAASGTAFDGSEPVERFSSDGPRIVFFNPDGSAITPGDFLSTGGAVRLKPDLAAADGVATATPGFSRFFGTSAAAPHAAAIAGLLLEADPTLTTASLRALVTSTALDIEAPGFDRDSGVGIFDAFDALAALGGTSADLSVSMADAPDPVVSGSNVTYTITVSNGGPDTAEGVTTTQNLPPGVPWVSATTSQGTCTPSGDIVTCDLGNVSSGGAVSMSTTLTPSTVGTIATDISASSITPDPDGGNNTASASTTVELGTLALTIDTIDGGSYGNGFGTPVSDQLTATFVGDGTSTYWLQVTGYDIDFDDEVSVHVNGTLVGHLSEGPNEDVNAGDVFTLTPAVTVSGVNTIEFREREPTWLWGVTGIGVLSTDPGGGPVADVELTVDAVDPGSYGNGFGSDSHLTSLVASFPGDSVTTYYLQVTGYDIDFDDEVSVHLNGSPIGHLARGPNNDVNAGDVFVIPAGTAVDGVNVIEFRERVSGWIWGVTAIGVLSTDPGGGPVADVELTVDAVDPGSYGNGFGSDSHLTSLIASFPGDSVTTYYLQVTGFDIDFDDEVSVHSNGSPIGHLARGPNDDFNAGDVFVIPAGTAVDGVNVVEFRERVSGWIWGVTAIGVLSTDPGGGPVADVELTVDTIDLGSYGNEFGSNAHLTSLIASFPGDDATTYYLQVTGYDIDFDDEVSVHLNGGPIGNLSRGPNNDFNAGDVFVIPAGTAINGVNLVEFRQRVSGWRWGVTAIGVLTSPP